MADKRDYYDILGIKKGATDDEIKKAYRTLAKKYHPDVSSEKDAEAKFKEVQEAYDTLSDAEKRQNYDQYGHQGNPFNGFGGGAGGFEGFGGFGDIFSQFFGGGQRQSSRASNGPNRGDDIERILTINFMDAVLGTKQEVAVDVDETCHTCHGTGAASKDDIETCSRCHGAGYVNVDQRTMFGTMRSQQVCSQCGGKGKVIKKRCNTCHGHGKVKETKKVDVTIPAGVDNNLTLRVSGYGHAGTNGGGPGDLYLTFRVRPHNVFKRRQDDIILEVPITVSQAVLGTKVDIPTIYGDVALKIPPGTSHGTVLRMAGQGVSNVQTKRKGDQLVHVMVEIPKTLSSEEKKLFETMAQLEEKKQASNWEKFKNLFK
jgi:molecular chaperone DnaJ